MIITRSFACLSAGMERWLSGRKQLPAKKLFGKPDRGFESHPLRQYSSNAILMALEEYIFEECWIRRPQRSASFRRRRKASAARGGLRKISIRKFICRRIPPSPPRITFRKIKVGCLGALRLGMVFPRQNPSIFEGERKRPLGNAEVPVRKHRENEVFRTNLFSFAFGERLSVFFFDCPKTNFKTIWTT